MILDKGIATLHHKLNTASAGGKPTFTPMEFFQSWYSELHFETSPSWPTAKREEIRADLRIRVLQNLEINNHDQVTLSPVYGGPTRTYEVTRAYHGRDDESGELISDLTLEEVRP